jgi:hypothetical protein
VGRECRPGRRAEVRVLGHRLALCSHVLPAIDVEWFRRRWRTWSRPNHVRKVVFCWIVRALSLWPVWTCVILLRKLWILLLVSDTAP